MNHPLRPVFYVAILLQLSLLLASCAASDPSADADTTSEELYADVTLPPLVIVVLLPSGSITGYSSVIAFPLLSNRYSVK